MAFGWLGVIPGMFGRGLHGALAVIQVVVLVITAMTIVNVLWMCLARRRRQRASEGVGMRLTEHAGLDGAPASAIPAARRRP